MRIGLVTTFPPQRCGIGTYSAALTEAVGSLPDVQLIVLAEKHANRPVVTPNGSQALVEAFDRRADWVSEVVQAATDAKVQLVHFQHAPDILGFDDRMPQVCRQLRAQHIASVVTMHTVYCDQAARIERRANPAAFHAALSRAADSIVVHQAEGTIDVLRGHGADVERIAVIPHGTGAMPRVDKLDARAQLDLPTDALVLLQLGFIHPQKNPHTPLRALGRIRHTRVPVHLVVIGAVQNPSWFNRAYIAALRGMIRLYDLGDRVRLHVRFAEEEELPVFFGAADVALLPYWQLYGSASGIVHLTLAAGKPMLVSDSPKFAEVRDLLGPEFVAPALNPEAWAEKIENLAADPQLLKSAASRVEQHAQETAWSRVGQQTKELYRRLLELE